MLWKPRFGMTRTRLARRQDKVGRGATAVLVQTVDAYHVPPCLNMIRMSHGKRDIYTVKSKMEIFQIKQLSFFSGKVLPASKCILPFVVGETATTIST